MFNNLKISKSQQINNIVVYFLKSHSQSKKNYLNLSKGLNDNSIGINELEGTGYRDLLKVNNTSNENILALNKLNLEVKQGEIFGLLGPNGAGKSTLLKVIMGFQEVDKGSVSMGKTESLGYLPQDGVEPNFSLNVVEEVRAGIPTGGQRRRDVYRLEDLSNKTANGHA